VGAIGRELSSEAIAHEDRGPVDGLDVAIEAGVARDDACEVS
jgi:hypothetical protein